MKPRCPCPAVEAKHPAETLGSKAFRFGIFRNRIEVAQGRNSPCSAMEIRRVRATRWDSADRPGAKADGSIEDCLVGQALVWSTGVSGHEEKFFYTMIPILAYRCLPQPRWPAENRLLCGRSQIELHPCDNLKNLAFGVEPPANPIRPTLRDGH
jgi:hypothetical protein